MNFFAVQSGNSGFFSIDFWKQLLNNDFNRGYFTALVLIVVVLALVLILRLILMLIFRRRRCRQVEVKCDGGNLLISREAITDATRNELQRYPQLSVNRIHLYRTCHHYSLVINCNFDPGDDGGSGVPELADQIKPQLLALFKRLFGIENLDRIIFSVESLGGENREEPVTVNPINVVDPGF